MYLLICMILKKNQFDFPVLSGILLLKKILFIQLCYSNDPTVMILNFLTERSGQTVQTQIRLLLEEQPDQGPHYLLFHLHVFDKIPSGLASLFEF